MMRYVSFVVCLLALPVYSQEATTREEAIQKALHDKSQGQADQETYHKPTAAQLAELNRMIQDNIANTKDLRAHTKEVNEASARLMQLSSGVREFKQDLHQFRLTLAKLYQLSAELNYERNFMLADLKAKHLKEKNQKQKAVEMVVDLLNQVQEGRENLDSLIREDNGSADYRAFMTALDLKHKTLSKWLNKFLVDNPKFKYVRPSVAPQSP